jgi:hypothetical protein
MTGYIILFVAVVFIMGAMAIEMRFAMVKQAVRRWEAKCFNHAPIYQVFYEPEMELSDVRTMLLHQYYELEPSTFRLVFSKKPLVTSEWFTPGYCKLLFGEGEQFDNVQSKEKQPKKH